MKFSGDRSGPYSKQAGTGLVGKVIGPNLQGQWFLVTDASYDAETDTTFTTVEPILDPVTQLQRNQGGTR